jgi:hypothetical protein
MPLRHLSALIIAVAACLATSSAQEKAEAAKVKVEIHLSAEHAPEGLKAGARANLRFVTSSTRTKTGRAVHSTRPLVDDVEVAAVKREEKPADPARAVLVELSVTKAQAEKVEKAKEQVVTVVESEGGKVVTKKRPIPLRLELAKPAKQ